jgi:hypothetical protein
VINILIRNSITKKILTLSAIVFVLIILVLFRPSALHAQHAVSASGTDIYGTGGSISYTLGQVVYEMYLGGSGTVVLGVQQPHEIYVYPGFENPLLIPPFVAVFPNPVLNLMTIQLDDDPDIHVVAVLYDITGKVLEQININSRQALMDLSTYARGVYILRVYHRGHSSQVFRVVKN